MMIKAYITNRIIICKQWYGLTKWKTKEKVEGETFKHHSDEFSRKGTNMKINI